MSSTGNGNVQITTCVRLSPLNAISVSARWIFEFGFRWPFHEAPQLEASRQFQES